eukprot:5692030-Prorocentrum_lima.AAC.1
MTSSLVGSEMCIRDSHTDLWGDVAHGGNHADAAMLDLGLAPALEVLHTAIRCETRRVEETHRILDSKL